MNINIGIVGLGYWGPNFARIINQLEDVNLAWCCDINNIALSKFSLIYPKVKTANSINPLLKDPNLHGVIVVTPAQEHFKLVKKFLLAGKDMLVEKPLTDDLREARSLVKIAKAKKRVLMVDHTFLFNGAIKKLKQLIDEGSLGKIYHIYGNYNALGPIRKDVSVMWDLPHFIYVVNFLLKTTPIWIQAAGKDYLQKGTADVVFLTCEYPDDILFHLNCSWMDPIKVRKLVVVGEKKMVVFDDMEPEEKIKIYNKGVDISNDPNFANLQIVVRHGDTLIPKLDLNEPLGEITERFIEGIKNRENNISNGEDGINLIKALHFAQQSLLKNGKRIYIK